MNILNFNNLPNSTVSHSKANIDVHLCPIEAKKPDYSFMPPDYT